MDDVAIIGAGLAGAAAAWTIAQSGRKSIILEARNRVGGRALSRPFGIGGELLDFGGSWITPWHERIRYYAEQTGIALRPRHAVVEHRWHDGEMLRVGVPCSDDERPAFDRAMARLVSDVDRYQRGEALDLARLPLNRYLDSIDASPATRSHVMAWWTISGNGDPDRISATELLSSCAYGGGRPEGMISALAHTLEPGAAVLCERMIAHSGAEVRLNTAATGVRVVRDSVVIAHGEGETRARCALLALPLNAVWPIEFSPALSDRKMEAVAIGHGGRSVKMWIKARGIRVGTLATGGPDGLRWLFAERAADDGATLIVGFGLEDFDPDCGDAVAHCLYRFFPEADLIAWDHHDWVVDPWARGTWVALPAEALWIGDPQVWSSEGRLAFASSDYAPRAAGWFEAALIAGEQAAHALLGKVNLLS